MMVQKAEHSPWGNGLMAMVGAMNTTNQKKATDSTTVFKQLLKEKKDSIAQLSAAEQEKLRKSEPFSLCVMKGHEAQKMNFRRFSDFKDIAEVNDAFNKKEFPDALCRGFR